MKIISNFKDYYDCIQGMGQDQTLLYVRNKKEIKYKEQPSLPNVSCYYRDKKFYNRSHTVGFCGKLYPILQIKFFENTKNIALEPPAVKIGLTTCFNAEDVDNFMKDNLKNKDLELYFDKQYINTGWWRYDDKLKQITFKRIFEEFNKHKDNYKELFEQYHCPIFIKTTANNLTNNRTKNEYDAKHKFIINGNLREVEFYKIFDPYQAFQEISMFLGNMASPEKEIPKLDDVTMAEIKGFDKYSFRKDKSD